MPAHATILGIDDRIHPALPDGRRALVSKALEHSLHQPGLASEVVMHESVVYSGSLGDGPHGHGVGANLLEEDRRRAYESVLAGGATS